MVFAAARRLLAEHAPRAGSHVLAACSGGADSVALVLFLDRMARRGGFSLGIASVDHGLRPEAAAEVQGVAALAAELERPFHGLAVDLGSGSGLQARARAARYRALEELAVQVGATHLALGHTADDQAETVLARLLRGAGVRGLAAMEASRTERGLVWLRPLLTTRRAELRRHLRDRAIPWVEDPSNEDPTYERVRLRRWLDRAQDEDPNLVIHLTDLARDAAGHRALVEAEVDRRDLVDAPARSLAGAPEVLRRAALRRWSEEVTGRPVGRAHLEALERLVLARTGEVLLPGGLAVTLSEDDRLVVGRGPARTRSGPRREPGPSR